MAPQSRSCRLEEVGTVNKLSHAGSLAPLLLAALAPGVDPPCQVAELTAADGAAGDQLGVAVSLSGDTALAGAFGADVEGFPGAGAVYVFERSGFTWTQTAKLTARDPHGADLLGGAVGLAGATAIVGADGLNPGGAAYVFERTGAGWMQTAQLIGGDTADGDFFGNAVAIDGDTVLIGARGDDDAGSRSGSAYVFERAATGWVQTQKLAPNPAAANDAFGEAVALRGDRALIGASRSGASATGSAFVFERTALGWAQAAELTASDGAPIDDFGSAVALGDGVALVGAQLDVSSGIGSAYVFELTPAGWVETAVLEPPPSPPGGPEFEEFGASVAVDGELALVGAPEPGLGFKQPGSGSAYLYRRTAAGWELVEKLEAGDGALHDQFGFAVAIDGTTALVGARLHDDLGSSSGSAYVFAANPGLALFTCPDHLSLAQGGTAEHRLAAPSHPGAPYLLLGSASGTTPGTPLDLVVVPLNAPDVYLDFTLVQANQPPFASTLGTLDAAGGATASVTLPPGLDPAFAGLAVHHAFAVFGPAGSAVLASNPALLTLVP